jgi:hypothetical protein
MQRALGRALPIFVLALACAICFASVATADVERQAVYCGLDGGDCDPANNNDFTDQASIMVEHSLTETGEYMWVGQTGSEDGGVAGSAPLNNDIAERTSIEPNYYDASGSFYSYIGGLAFDPEENVIFISDTNANRVVAFRREHEDLGDGFFIAYNRDDPAQSPFGNEEFGTQDPGDGDGEFDGPRALTFNAATHELYAIDSNNYRVETFDYEQGGDGGTSHLNYTGEFAADNWNSDDSRPLDIAADPTSGKVYVALSGHNVIQEFSAGGELLREIGDDAGEPPAHQTVAVDGTAGLLYAGTGYGIDIYSIATGQLLGSYSGSNFIAGESSDNVTDIDVDPVGHDLYALTDTENYDASGTPPAAGYAMDPPPTCIPAAPISVAVGESIQLPLNCTDADGAPVKEFSTSGAPNLGAATPSSDRASLTYKAGFVPGSDSVKYTVLTANGKSSVYSQPVTVIGASGPIIRKLANLEPVSGKVFIKLPGSDVYIPLEEATLIPIGTIIDARGGHAHLTLANADGTTYEGEFWEGLFQVLQGEGDHPIATLKLRDDLLGDTHTRAAIPGSPFDAVISRKRGKKKNGLWGNAKGNYRTSGKGGSATVRGTFWYVANYANGTYFKVNRGIVDVKTLHCPTFKLKAGHSHFQYFENLTSVKFVGKRKHPLDRGCGKS